MIPRFLEKSLKAEVTKQVIFNDITREDLTEEPPCLKGCNSVCHSLTKFLCGDKSSILVIMGRI